MSVEKNKALVRAFLARAADGEVDAQMAMVADGGTWWIPTDKPGGLVLSKEEMRSLAGAFYAIMERKPTIEIQAMTAEDDRVCVQMTTRGAMTKGGAAYANDYLMALRIEKGQIAEVREYLNPLLAGAIGQEIESFQGG